LYNINGGCNRLGKFCLPLTLFAAATENTEENAQDWDESHNDNAQEDLNLNDELG